ncbi:hypothetical protein J2Z65_002063 [Paenibacillus aceris]|uniref:Uncharacterized protein n=1 Tax=Paenibacillus aceris TaxID=869555 RepID=A0ABS4HW38_9BACL|nr:hypothetical protein [Paenibacillus aceris]
MKYTTFRKLGDTVSRLGIRGQIKTKCPRIRDGSHMSGIEAQQR